VAWYLVKYRGNFTFGSWDSSVIIVMRLRVGRVEFDSWKGKEIFSLPHRVQTGPEDHRDSYPNGNWKSWPGSKAAGA
jgi:hypothetical protein